MSSFEWNKIIASVLTAMILAMVSGILATQLVRPKALEKPVFLPAGAEQVAAASAEQPAAAKLEPIEPLLAAADPKRGEQLAKVCAVCHTFNKGRSQQDRAKPLGCYRGGDCRCPKLSVLCRIAGGQGHKMGSGKAESVAL